MTLKLNISLIYLLELLRKGTNNPKELRKKIKLSKLQFHNLLKDLKNLDYIDENGDVLKFKENTKSILYRDIANKYDVQKILHDSNESIFCELTEYKTKTEIQGKTGLSLRTIERAITEMKSIGIIIISKDTKKIMINKDKDEKLYLFAKNIKTEQRKNIESYAEIIYQDSLRILKKIPKGKFAKGELSGFSMFSSYGVEYVTSYDYYIEQNTPLKLEEIVIHAILISDKNKDKNDLCMSIIFYLKNKDSFDPLKIRETARNYKISGIWLDIESYLRNTEVTNPSLFLPWNEFEEKSKLYDILPEQYLLPEAYPDLFKDIGKKLTTKIEIYILGGENMRIKKLKSRTRDCDLVVNDKKSYENIVNILMAMGYNIKRSLQLDDRRIEPLEILIHPERSRIDLFVQVIAGKMYLSEGMKNRAEISNYGNLNVGLLSNEDVFLLKSITAREGDIQDMANLALTSNFQWKIILDELDAQEEKTRKNFSELVLESLDDLYEQRGISSHLYKKLEKKVLDYKIREQIIKGNSSIGKIVELLKGKFISEKKIRNRINYLQRINYLKKNQKKPQTLMIWNWKYLKFKTENHQHAKKNKTWKIKIIDLFNADLQQANLEDANLQQANLESANLKGANLQQANLEDANLQQANLESANLNRTNLYFTRFSGASLVNASLIGTNLLETDLSKTNLENTNLSYANINLPKGDFASYDALYYADFSKSNFSHANFTDADLSHSIIINPKSYNNIKINNNTSFSDAIIDDTGLINRIKRFTDKVPSEINTKKELKNRISKLDEVDISDKYLNITNLK